ncbi:MAG: GIY-YIG nuclease family protein [Peptostreptococcaceae bacterium]|jgi:hypothetical protein|nr:GIY-YIG nuclease family protein [Peptostreptococcaceae bacterium]
MSKYLKKPWYLNTIIIFLLMLLHNKGILVFISLILLFLQYKFDKNYKERLKSSLEIEISIQAKKILDDANLQASNILKSNKNLKLENLKQQETLNYLTEKVHKFDKQKTNLEKNIIKLKTAKKSIEYSVKYYRENGEFVGFDTNNLKNIYPTIIIPTHSMDVKTLKSQSTQIKNQIKKLLEQYNSRYTTKANKSIYSLMTLALQAELQNILQSLKYDKLDNAKEKLKLMTAKYLLIAGDGNKNTYNTLVKFIGEIESHFIDLIETEYIYYVKKEKEKEEQRALKEQMRQEAEEKKRLKEEQKKIEKEESKFIAEIESINNIIENEKDNEKIKQLEEKLKNLEMQLKEVDNKKEEIKNLQNGKAGYVYIISNKGSFGSDVFKVGMTRRLEPMDRIKELSGASVPFSFDVHSFIFSENAPKLESQLHSTLNQYRVNKVNPRKEFFKVPIDFIEDVTYNIDPTAEFKKTILAREYEESKDIA